MLLDVLIHKLAGYIYSQHVSCIRGRSSAGKPRVERSFAWQIITDNVQAFAPKFCELSLGHGCFCSFSFYFYIAKLRYLFGILKQLFLLDFLRFSKALSFSRLYFSPFFLVFLIKKIYISII